ISQVSLCQVKHRAPENDLLLSGIHRRKSSSLPSVRTVLHFTEYNIFPVFCNNIYLSCFASVIIFQNLIPDALQVTACCPLVIRPGLPAVSPAGLLPVSLSGLQLLFFSVFFSALPPHLSTALSCHNTIPVVLISAASHPLLIRSFYKRFPV